MARGWESKSVEAQIDEAAQQRSALQAILVSRDDADRMRRRDSLLLSRKRVLHDIETTTNTRYRQLMERALAELDTQLAALP
jgi:hypothetical protein